MDSTKPDNPEYTARVCREILARYLEVPKVLNLTLTHEQIQGKRITEARALALNITESAYIEMARQESLAKLRDNLYRGSHPRKPLRHDFYLNDEHIYAELLQRYHLWLEAWGEVNPFTGETHNDASLFRLWHW
jgi:hypothetical protein